METSLRDVFDAAVSAFVSGNSACPYEDGTKEKELWDAGIEFAKYQIRTK